MKPQDSPRGFRLQHERNRTVLIDAEITPVADGVDFPTFGSLAGEFHESLFPVGAVFPEKIAGVEAEAVVIFVPILEIFEFGIKSRTVPLPEIPVLWSMNIRRVFKIMFLIGDDGRFQRPELVDAVREEKFAGGVYQPPFAFIFDRIEIASGFETRSGGPAAEFRSVRSTGMGGNICFFRLPGCDKIGTGMDLTGPVGVFVLAEYIDERVKSLCAFDSLGNRFRRSFDANVADGESRHDKDIFYKEP